MNQPLPTLYPHPGLQRRPLKPISPLSGAEAQRKMLGYVASTDGFPQDGTAFQELQGLAARVVEAAKAEGRSTDFLATVVSALVKPPSDPNSFQMQRVADVICALVYESGGTHNGPHSTQNEVDRDLNLAFERSLAAVHGAASAKDRIWAIQVLGQLSTITHDTMRASRMTGQALDADFFPEAMDARHDDAWRLLLSHGARLDSQELRDRACDRLLRAIPTAADAAGRHRWLSSLTQILNSGPINWDMERPDGQLGGLFYVASRQLCAEAPPTTILGDSWSAAAAAGRWREVTHSMQAHIAPDLESGFEAAPPSSSLGARIQQRRASQPEEPAAVASSPNRPGKTRPN